MKTAIYKLAMAAALGAALSALGANDDGDAAGLPTWRSPCPRRP